MLKVIKDNIQLLDNKMLVDTVFSLGKLHKAHSKPEKIKDKINNSIELQSPIEALNKYGDLKFFQHLFREIMLELLSL